MPTCSMPKIPYFRDWYEKSFKDLCLKHDHAYRDQEPRLQADLDFTAGIVTRGYPLLALASYYFIRVVGYWEYRKAAKNVQVL